MGIWHIPWEGVECVYIYIYVYCSTVPWILLEMAIQIAPKIQQYPQWDHNIGMNRKL